MNKFEENFKQSLENFEVSYDPKAWEKLSTKLDLKEKKSNQKSINRFNNFLFIGATTLILTGIYFMYNPKSTASPKTTKKTAVSENKSSLELRKPSNEIEIRKNSSNTINTTNNKKKQTINKEINVTSNQKNQFKNDKKESIYNEISTETNTQKTAFTQNKEFEIPKTKSTYCENEPIFVINNNNFNLYIVNEKGRKIYKLPAKSTHKYAIKEAGVYQWLSEENSIRNHKAFEVQENPNANFTMPNELDFTEGIPKINCSTSSNASIQWIINNKPISINKEISISIFSKGTSTISLKLENNEGCKSIISKTIELEENYNLLAVTGFEPSHYDNKRNSFIPYALTIRTTPFKMVIIDPKNNKIIFETSDSSKPWDGIDQTTNEMVPENSTYIWKVTLFKPEKNEKSEYIGKITRI